jgi:hypothetical protein
LLIATPNITVDRTVATATASVEQELAGGVDPRRVREIAAQPTRPDGDRAADAATGAAT